MQFRKGNEITIFEAMSGLIQGGNKALFVDTSDDARHGGFATWVEDCELLAEVAENRSEQAKGIGNNEINALLVAVITNNYLIFDWSISENDYLKLVECGEICCQAMNSTLAPFLEYIDLFLYLGSFRTETGVYALSSATCGAVTNPLSLPTSSA